VKVAVQYLAALKSAAGSGCRQGMLRLVVSEDSVKLCCWEMTDGTASRAACSPARTSSKDTLLPCITVCYLAYLGEEFQQAGLLLRCFQMQQQIKQMQTFLCAVTNECLACSVPAAQKEYTDLLCLHTRWTCPPPAAAGRLGSQPCCCCPSCPQRAPPAQQQWALHQ
jgi:hypothetical protein